MPALRTNIDADPAAAPAAPWPRRARRGGLAVIALLGSVALGACREEPAPGPETPRPSLLLLTLDTTRADALGCYGASPSRTPVLDEVAATGTRFTQARTPVPLTLPSHSSLMTGRFPFEHGVRDNGTFQLGEEARTLAEVLADAGYATGAAVASGVLNGTYGLAQGFDEYHDLAATSLAGPELGYRKADEMADLATRWLERRDGARPFFLWAHFFDPHRPLQPPEEFLNAQFGSRQNAMALPTLDRDRGLYAAEVAFMDREVGRVLAAARAASGGDLLVVITSDHGEGNGDHGEVTHGYFLYDSTLLVPLLMAGPGIPAGATVEHAVSLVDVMPTLLDLLSLEGEPSSGVSLRPLLDGGAIEDDGRPMYFESVYPYLNHRWSPLWGLKSGPYKLIDSAKPHLFDLTRDPGEREDRFEDQPREVAALRARIASLRSRTRLAARHQLDEEERAKLQALGYVSADPTGGDADVFQPGTIPPGLRDTQDCIQLIELHGMAYTHRINGNLDIAVRLILDVLAQDPDNPYYLKEAGEFLLADNRAMEAEPRLRRACELEPQMSAAWRALATAQRRLGQKDAAIESLQHLVATEPSDVKARLDLGQLLFEQRGLRDEAILMLESALELLDPETELAGQVRQKVSELRQGGA